VLDVKAGSMRASIHELFGFRSDKIWHKKLLQIMSEKLCKDTPTSELAAGMIIHVHTCLNSRRTYRCRPSGGAGPMYGIFSCPVSHISASIYKLKMSKTVSHNFTC
jgi:hypothetical protein